MGVDEIDGYVAGANVNLYANAVNYLVGQSNMISVKPTTVSNDMAVFTARASKMVIAVGIIHIDQIEGKYLKTVQLQIATQLLIKL